mgnify:CR=1 FL=1
MVNHTLVVELRNKIAMFRINGGTADEVTAVIQELRQLESHGRKPSAIGLTPVVGCEHRGKPVRPNIKVACQTCGGNLKDVEYTPYECSQFGRCLPSYKPKNEQLELWKVRKPESDLYHLCGSDYCAFYSPRLAENSQIINDSQ